MVRKRRFTSPLGAYRRLPSAWRENVESFVWAIALALLIRTFIVAPFKIPSGSMRPTLIEGDRILVNKFIYRFRHPQRGEVIVFRYPYDLKRPFIKRLAAVGGDTVEIRDQRLFINGAPAQDTPVFHDRSYYNQGSFGQAHQVITVPEGMYYVLGDNSGFSHDSRFWGFVPTRLVIGRAIGIFWPPNRWRLLR